jgi:hypothetical protein
MKTNSDTMPKLYIGLVAHKEQIHQREKSLTTEVFVMGYLLEVIRNEMDDRGRNGALICAAPPSEPCERISRTRLSSQWFAPFRRLAISSSWASSRQKYPSFVK